jgi:hypothetical protein
MRGAGATIVNRHLRTTLNSSADENSFKYTRDGCAAHIATDGPGALPILYPGSELVLSNRQRMIGCSNNGH